VLPKGAGVGAFEKETRGRMKEGNEGKQMRIGPSRNGRKRLWNEWAYLNS